MHQAHHQRTHVDVDPEPRECAVEARQRPPTASSRRRMRVEVTSAFVSICDHCRHVAVGKSDRLRHGSHETAHVDEAKRHEHQADGKLHAEPYSYWDHQLESNDGDSQRNDRERMPDAPTDPDEGRAINRVLPGDDGGNRDDVIWISGVADTENKTNCDDGDYAEHVSLRSRLTFALMDRTPMRQPLRQRGPGRRCHR